MNANVSPVGARKAMGWPHIIEYTIPLAPALNRNSTTPIESFVICDAIVPKLIAGERQAKYKNNTAGITFFQCLKPSVQSDT
mmetsp:Transcript_9503/g.20568  ORF Transcript_9503/g.20568 Transcript_9503/m.20568 type:complete len:82 (+) Transcript_9503:3158-3403(+)